MAEPLGHENQVTFFNNDGHNHDGRNSTLVDLQPGQISLFHLDPALVDWIENQAGDTGATDDDVFPVPDLVFETPPVSAGGVVTGTVPWVTLSVVRFMRILMSRDTQCTITFYHVPTFADEDREFRAIKCGNKFLWEGAWAHFDETGNKQLHYKIENTGSQSAVFQVTLKSGTMAANAYARFVEAIQVNGEEVTGTVLFNGGNGIDISLQENTIHFNAVAPETVYVKRWASSPIKPVGFSSSAAISNSSYLSTGRTDQSAQFGTGIQWIRADRGSIRNLAGVKVGMYASDGRVFQGVRLGVSPDGSNWIEVKSSGPVWGTEDGFEVNFVSGLLARYVRLWCNGSDVNNQNFVSKIQAFGLSNKE